MRKSNKRTNELGTWDEVVSSRYKRDPEFLKLAIKRNFKEYIKTGDDFFLRQTLKRAAAVKGITKLAKETGLSRQYIYDMLSEKGNPTLLTFRSVLKALGFEMYIRAVKSA